MKNTILAAALLILASGARAQGIVSGGAAAPLSNTITESTITVTLLNATTVQIRQDGTTAAWAAIYPNAPLVMLGNANSYVQAVIQNINNGTSAQSAYVLSGDLGSDTSYYANVQKSNSRFSNSGYAVFPSSSMVLYDSDSPVYVWADTNGGQYGGSGKIVFGSSNAVAGNVAMTIMSATASGPGAVVINSSVTASSNVSVGIGIQLPIQASGGVGAPAISWTGDTNTGFYNNSAGNLQVAVSGSQDALFNANGLTVFGSNSTPNAPNLSLRNAGTGFHSTGAGNITFDVSSSSKMVLNSTGLGLGLGPIGPASLLHMSSGTLTIDGTNASINVAASNTQSSFGQMISTGAGSPQFTIAPGANSNVSGAILIRDGAAGAASRDIQIITTDQTVGDVSLKGGSLKGVNPNLLYQNWTSSQSYFRAGMNIGIGDTTPDAQLEILSATAGASYVLAVSSQTDIIASVFGVTGGGHIVSSGTTPGIACNAGSPVMLADSNDVRGSFTAGTAAVNCTITFANAWSKSVACMVMTNAATPIAISVTPGTATNVFTALAALTGDTLYYTCIGAP